MTGRVAAVSVAPLFPDAVHGGSQRVLDAVLRGLADAGATVRVLCSLRPENAGGFELAPGVTVEPVLPLKGFFPEPWDAPPYRIAAAAEAARPVFEWADAVYLHADTFYLRSLIPPGRRVVRSFHDFHYETALISAFGFSADLTIVPSMYLKRCIEAAAGAVRGDSLEPVAVIPNGIDLAVYAPGTGEPPPDLAPRSGNDLVVLWPHRPDVRKGIREAIKIVAALKMHNAGRPVRLLVPRHVDAASSAATREFYDDALGIAADNGVIDGIEFTTWYDGVDMAGLYGYADVTLCPGNFIESFGLTAYESLACGTPVVAARVGALRDLPGHPDVRTVDYGDIEAAADAVEAAAEGMRDGEGARELLRRSYGFDDMKRAYTDAILGTAPDPPPRTVPPGDRLTLAPWCHVSGGRVYNDYEYGYAESSAAGPAGALARFIASSGGRPFTSADARADGVSSAALHRAHAEGLLVTA